MLTDMQETWLWIGFAGMTLGALTIAGLGRRLPHKERHHAVASFFVCLLAAASYFAMANAQGVTTTADGREVFYARYIDWAVTTPLLLLGLLMVALPPIVRGDDSGRDRNALVAGVIGADVFMIVTGVIAALTADETVKYVWYTVSCGAFLAVIALIFGPVREAARTQGESVFGLFKTLAGTLAVLWFIYPVLWLLGTEGTGAIDLTSEVFVFAAIDLSAKVGFGILLVTGVARHAAQLASRSDDGRKASVGSAA